MDFFCISMNDSNFRATDDLTTELTFLWPTKQRVEALNLNIYTFNHIVLELGSRSAKFTSSKLARVCRSVDVIVCASLVGGCVEPLIATFS